MLGVSGLDFKIKGLILLIALLILLSTLTLTVSVTNAEVIFSPRTYVIPLDDKQNDVIKAFGFIYSVLENGGEAFRVIEPPMLLYFQ